MNLLSNYSKKFIVLFLASLLLIHSASANDINFDASVPDNDPPSIAVISHVSGSIYTPALAPNMVTGVAADNSTGLGLNANSTTFTLTRASDGWYWSGSTWVPTLVNLPTLHSATNASQEAVWASSLQFPNFVAGTYTIIATATDKGGNSMSTGSIVFSVAETIVSPPVEPPVTPPVEPPVVPPTEPPIEPPVEPPVEPPIQPPIEPPVEQPTELLDNFPWLITLHENIAWIIFIGLIALSLLTALLYLPQGLLFVPQLAFWIALIFRRGHHVRVFDSVTGERIEGALVSLVYKGKVVDRQTTDQSGKAIFSVEEGNYKIKVSKKDYSFPSKIATSGYFGNILDNQKGYLSQDIPIDNLSKEASQKSLNLKNLGFGLSTIWLCLMILGTLLALIFLVERGLVIDWIIAALYVLIWAVDIYNISTKRGS